MTSSVSIDGPGNHDLSQHAIFCFWHELAVGASSSIDTRRRTR
jgi:hypothetical protein